MSLSLIGAYLTASERELASEELLEIVTPQQATSTAGEASNSLAAPRAHGLPKSILASRASPMASKLLRKVKSTIPGTRSKHNHADYAPPVDFSNSIESPLNFSRRPSLSVDRDSTSSRQASPITDFKKRLARKASTISLRTKSRKGEWAKSRDKYLPPPVEAHSSQTILDGEKPHTANTTSTAPHEQTIQELSSSGEKTPTQRDFSLAQSNQKTEQGLEAGVGSWVKMSAEASSPPVPVVRLKEIATEACSNTLATANSYVHSQAESWNTQIINIILSALVKESTLPSAPQPQWKYVVNSTIIQHPQSPTSSSPGDDKPSPVLSRRGMHQASGAYWNNEKDGMWSFKYEAAESKGLDIVISVSWIWVG